MLKSTNSRALVVFVHDIIMTALSFGISAYLRLGEEFFIAQNDRVFAGVLTLVVSSAVIYWRVGLYKGVWRYASVQDLVAIAKAVSLTLLVFILVMFVWTRLETLPRSLPFINWLVLMAMLGGPRLAYRIFRDRRFDLKDAPGGKRRIPVLLVGAGDGAELFIRGLKRDQGSEYRVIGIVAETPRRVGQQIHGIPVLDTLDHLPEALERLSNKQDRPQRLILTKDTFDGALVRRLFDQAGELGMSLARVPDITELASGDLDKIKIRPINVEDLLGRPQTTLDRSAMKEMVSNRRVLVTGAGGSIGSELVRQLIAFGPSKIGLLDNSEYALYQIDHEIAESAPQLPRQPVISDVRNASRIEQVFASFKPELVFHAAALKHVPLVEENCCEGVLTNTVGTRIVADACVRNRVQTMVQISTDKAINPSNVMGASKRVAEQYCQALDVHRGEGGYTNFVTVRFGNVLGSTGSVVPLFQKQLENGGPLTVTHPDMTRYFMTVREAVGLVLLAAAKARPGANQDGKIFVLDMGEPVRILDLAEQMIRLAGFTPGENMEIKITGCRPGEKLFEEIFHGGEALVESGVDGIFLAAPRIIAIKQLSDLIEKLAEKCVEGDEERVRMILSELVPEATLNGSS